MVWCHVYHHLNHNSPGCKVSVFWVLSAFSPPRSLTFSSLTVMICLGIILYKFILFGIYWSFGTNKNVFHQIWQILDPFLQNFSAPNVLWLFTHQFHFQDSLLRKESERNILKHLQQGYGKKGNDLSVQLQSWLNKLCYIPIPESTQSLKIMWLVYPIL